MFTAGHDRVNNMIAWGNSIMFLYILNKIFKQKIVILIISKIYVNYYLWYYSMNIIHVAFY